MSTDNNLRTEFIVVGGVVLEGIEAQGYLEYSESAMFEDLRLSFFNEADAANQYDAKTSDRGPYDDDLPGYLRLVV